jgi:hypothetical protein
VARVFALDSAGNTLALDTDALAAAGLPTTLQVVSSVDNTAPKLDGLSFAPRAIDTRLGSAGITLNVMASDDLSGLRLFEATFVSPSGTATQRIRFDLTPAAVVNTSRTLTFPRFSEAGNWTLSAVFLADSAGNTLALDAEGLAAMGISETLTVESVQDTTPPRLAAFSLIPAETYTGDVAVKATVSFQVTDDLSGATAFQIGFSSPSGHIVQNAAASFAPSLSEAATATVVFPAGSESGIWTIAAVFLADAAGNTTTLTASDLAEHGFPHQLRISNRPPGPSPDR